MSLHSIVISPFVTAFSLALLHFLWQGILIAAFLGATLTSLEKANAPARYTAACSALFLMALAPIFTFCYCLPSPSQTTTLQQTSAFVDTSVSPPLWPTFVVLAWFLGAMWMSARLFVGLTRLSSLLRHHTLPAPAWVRTRFYRLSRRLRITKSVRLLGSRLIDVPMVVGFLRPVVLVPLPALFELSPSHLDALLAHELSHVKRLDFLINILQSIVEAALFYHPAVYWVSRHIRKERENLCDDDAVSAVGDPILYARALAELEVLRATLPALALGSNGGSLMTRIQRQIEGKKPRTPLASALAAPLIVLTSTLGLALATLASCAAEPPPKAATTQTAQPTTTLDIAWLPPVLRPWESAITKAATHHGVDANAVAIVTLVESAGDPKAKSPSGALGLMQLMPKTASIIAQELGIKDHAEERLLDPAYNLDLGASYFKQQLSTFSDQDPNRAIELAAAAYNGGPTIVREWLSGKTTLSEETDHYKTLVSGMWNERSAPHSTTYETWRARIRSKMANRAKTPLPGARKTLLFGEKTPGEGKPHEGIDLAIAPKTTIRAPLDGTIERLENGNEPTLVIRHNAGLETRYRHIEAITKKPGETITRGEIIGQVSDSKGGPHLHFEVLDQGAPIDPMPYIREE